MVSWVAGGGLDECGGDVRAAVCAMVLEAVCFGRYTLSYREITISMREISLVVDASYCI